LDEQERLIFTGTQGGIEMNPEMNEFKRELSVKWIKADSGNTYLCPVDALERIASPSEADLRMICVDESRNPQND